MKSGRYAFALVVSGLFLVSAKVHAGGLDGAKWVQAQRAQKTGFVTGLASGANTVYSKIYTPISDLVNRFGEYRRKGGTIFSLPDELGLNLVFMPSVQNTLDEMSLPDAETEKIVDRVDKLYAETANRKIQWIDAVYVTKMQIEGKSAEWIDVQTRFLRMQPIPDNVYKDAREAYEKVLGDILRRSGERIPTEAPEVSLKDIKEGVISVETLTKCGYFITESDKIAELFCYGSYE